MEGDKRNGDPHAAPGGGDAPRSQRPDRLDRGAGPRPHGQSKALCRGSYRNVLVQPKQLIFERYADGERVLVAINADGNPYDRAL